MTEYTWIKDADAAVVDQKAEELIKEGWVRAENGKKEEEKGKTVYVQAMLKRPKA